MTTYTLETSSLDIREVKRAAVIQALRLHKGNMSAAARELFMDRRTLYRFCEGLERAGDEEMILARSNGVPLNTAGARTGRFDASKPSLSNLPQEEPPEGGEGPRMGQNSWQDL